MGTFIGQLVGFAVVCFLFWKYVLPVLKKAVKTHQDTIETQVSESEQAAARVVDAQAAHQRAVESAKVEAEQLREAAAKDAEDIASDIRALADREVARISEHGKAQTELFRSSLVRQLRNDLGLAAVDGAGELVRTHLADPGAREASVDRVIDELESMATSASTPSVPHSSELIGLHSMRAASREAARTVARDFDGKATDLDASALATAGSELTEVIAVLDSNPVLRKRLTEDEDNAPAKEALARNVFGGKVSPIVVDVVALAATQRWSTGSDFLAALRRQNALVVLAAAERAGVSEQVEDELFRVSRLLEANPQLASLLSDYPRDWIQRVGLLEGLVGGKVDPHTWSLLAQTIRFLHGQPAEVAVDHLAELAAARRGESVSHVVSAAPLTEAQKERLAGVLGNIYGRTISVQTEVRPEILGGLRIGVGDEIIDADIATRLAKATETLPR